MVRMLWDSCEAYVGTVVGVFYVIETVMVSPIPCPPPSSSSRLTMKPLTIKSLFSIVLF